MNIIKIELKKGLPIRILTIVTSISTIVFATLSIANVDSWIFRIFAQGSLCLIMMFNGINFFVYKKQKAIGLFLWLVCGFLLFVMIFIIKIGR